MCYRQRFWLLYPKPHLCSKLFGFYCVILKNTKNFRNMYALLEQNGLDPGRMKFSELNDWGHLTCLGIVTYGCANAVFFFLPYSFFHWLHRIASEELFFQTSWNIWQYQEWRLLKAC
jgi:hypothetical protein